MTQQSPTRAERIAGGMIGLLVGDALGVPYEFKSPGDIPSFEHIEFNPPLNYPRSHAAIPPGTYSDDGAQALCLLLSLLEHNQLDLDDFGQKLLDWYSRGFLAVDDHCFDVGIQTRAALGRLGSGIPAAESGPGDEYSNGNGSLMRVLPLALWHKGGDRELVADAQKQSLVTHRHPRSQVCCALYCLWARRTLDGNESADAWNAAASSLQDILAEQPEHAAELKKILDPETSAKLTGSGYVVDCLLSARTVCSAGSYEQVVKAAIAMGNDTDTTTAVAGGIAGLRVGVAGIPPRWRERLRGRVLYGPMLVRLVDHSG